MAEAQALIEGIIAQAQEEAEQILAAARAKAAARLTAAQEELRQKEAALMAAFTHRAELEERRINTEAELEIRRERLRMKAALIEKAFAEAYRALTSLPADQERTFLGRLLMAAAETGEEEVVVAPSVEKKYASLLAEVNEERQRQGRKGGLRLVTDPTGPEEGFLLRGPEYTVDCSFRALLAAKRALLEPEVAGILFGRPPVEGK